MKNRIERNRYILADYAVLLAITLIVLLLVNTAAVFISGFLQILSSEVTYTESESEVITEAFSKCESFPLLAEYWKGHPQMLSRTEESSGESADESPEGIYALLDGFEGKIGVKLFDMTGEKFKSLTMSEKAWAAENAYGFFSSLISGLGSTGRDTLEGPLLISYPENGESIVLINADNTPGIIPGSTLHAEFDGIDTYIPKIAPFHKFSGNAADALLEITTGAGERKLGIFHPVTVNGRTDSILVFILDDIFSLKKIALFAWDIIKADLVLSLIIAIVFLVSLYFIMLRPLNGIEASVRDYREDHDVAKVVQDLYNIRSRNEMGRLADDIAYLASKIEEVTEKRLKPANEEKSEEPDGEEKKPANEEESEDPDDEEKKPANEEESEDSDGEEKKPANEEESEDPDGEEKKPADEEKSEDPDGEEKKPADEEESENSDDEEKKPADEEKSEDSDGEEKEPADEEKSENSDGEEKKRLTGSRAKVQTVKKRSRLTGSRAKVQTVKKRSRLMRRRAKSQALKIKSRLIKAAKKVPGTDYITLPDCTYSG